MQSAETFYFNLKIITLQGASLTTSYSEYAVLKSHANKSTMQLPMMSANANTNEAANRMSINSANSGSSTVATAIAVNNNNNATNTPPVASSPSTNSYLSSQFDLSSTTLSLSKSLKSLEPHTSKFFANTSHKTNVDWER